MAQIDLGKLIRFAFDYDKKRKEKKPSREVNSLLDSDVLRAVGARDFLHRQDYVTFRIQIAGKTDKKYYVRIKYGDTYTVRVFSIDGLRVDKIREQSMIDKKDVSSVVQTISAGEWF